MKSQTIYPLLIAALTTIVATHSHAQTSESGVSEARIRRLVSPDDETGKALRFAPVPINRAVIPSTNFNQVTSPSSAQELRALIFENYTPPGGRGIALRSATIPKQPASGAGADKLPSESAAGEATAAKQTATPVNTPPTQGDAKEEQQ